MNRYRSPDRRRRAATIRADNVWTDAAAARVDEVDDLDQVSRATRARRGARPS